MNKKFFSAVLMGALLLGGTFVSCQDYDDDIENLQNQIDKLASADLLNQKASELQSAISTAQSAASGAQSAADAAKSAAKTADDKAAAAQAAADALKANVDKAATKEEAAAAKTAADAAQAVADAAKAAAEAAATPEAVDAAIAAALANYATAADLAALEAKVEALKTQIEGATTEAALEALKADLDKLAAQVEAATGAKVSGVTAISLYATKHEGVTLDYRSTIAKATTFEMVDENQKIEIAAGLTPVSAVKSVVVRVSPSNADLTKSDIKLVNSKGENLSEFLAVEAVPYDKLLTKAEAAGLWKVTFNLKEDKSREDLLEVVQTKKEDHILFALSIDGALSEFDIDVEAAEYAPYAPLNFNVVGKTSLNISNIKNRAGAATTKGVKELVWKANAAGKIVPQIEEDIVFEGDSANVVAGDNRSAKPYLIVDKLDDNDEVSFDIQFVNNYVRAWYVTYDWEYAKDNGSEKNAWKAYYQNGLHKFYENETEATITLGSSKDDRYDLENNEVIGFRLFAINYDGTLVDPDGQAFYIKISTGSAEVAKAAVSLSKFSVLDNWGVIPAADIAAAFGDLTGKTVAIPKLLSVKKGDKDYTAVTGQAGFTFEYVDDAEEMTTDGTFAPKGDWTDKDNQVDIAVKMTGAANKLIDGATYTYEYKIYNGDDEDAINDMDLYKTVTVSVVKTMPTAHDSVSYRKFVETGVLYPVKDLNKTGVDRYANNSTKTSKFDLATIFDLSNLDANDSIIVNNSQLTTSGTNKGKYTTPIKIKYETDAFVEVDDSLVAKEGSVDVLFRKVIENISATVVNGELTQDNNFRVDQKFSMKYKRWTSGVEWNVLNTHQAQTGWSYVPAGGTPATWEKITGQVSTLEFIWNVDPSKSGLYSLVSGSTTPPASQADADAYKLKTEPHRSQDISQPANRGLNRNVKNNCGLTGSARVFGFNLDSIVVKSDINATAAFNNKKLNELISANVIDSVKVDQDAYELTGLQEYFDVEVAKTDNDFKLGLSGTEQDKYFLLAAPIANSPTPSLKPQGETINIPVKIWTSSDSFEKAKPITVNIPVHFTAVLE